MKAFHQLGRAALSSVMLIAMLVPAFCQTVEDFYRQKGTIRLIHGTSSGSAYHNWGQLLANHMQKYIPGNPKIIVEAMPGGGGIVAANYLHAVAPKDGTVLGSISRSGPLQAFLGKQKTITFDPRQFNWLGSVELRVRACAVRTDTGVSKVSDLLEKEVSMGGTGPGSGQSFMPIALNRLIGTKFKVVNGYRGAPEINLAIMRGEVSGICGNADTIVKDNRALLDAGQMRVLFTLERHQDPSLQGTPWIGEFIQDASNRQVLDFINSPTDMGRPYLTTPGVPSDRVAALTSAFEKAVADPSYKADVIKAGYDLSVTKGEELAANIAKLYATPKHIVDRAVELMPEGGIGD